MNRVVSCIQRNRVSIKKLARSMKNVGRDGEFYLLAMNIARVTVSGS